MATNQRDAGSNAINTQDGSVVNQPHLRDVHAAGNINMNVNNTYYDFSRLSLSPRTKLHQSAVDTVVNSPSPWAWTREASHRFFRPPPEFLHHRTSKKRSVSLYTTMDDSHLALKTRKLDLSEDKRDVMMSEQLIQTHSLASSDFTPELSNESGAISYRFRCPGPGVFQCKLTKLVFTMDREGKILYRTVQWDESRLQLAGKRPAGPLFNIKCPEDAVSKLHLPHCEIKPAPLCLSVVHISDDGMNFLQPLKITDTHVVVDVPHLSVFGLVLETTSSSSPNPELISGQVLLFHQPAYMRQRPKLNVFLLPYNVPVPEVKGKHEKAQHIVTPSSCDLIEGQTYSLHCPEAYKVVPKDARFKFNYKPNYHPTFEIRLNPNTDEANLTVQDQEKKDIWEYPVELTGSTSISVSSSPPLPTQPSASQPTTAEGGVSASSSSALPTQPSASQPTTAEGGATTQRDAGSTAINAKNGSVVSHPQLRHVHVAGDMNINVNNTPSGPGLRGKNLQRTNSL